MERQLKDFDIEQWLESFKGQLSSYEDAVGPIDPTKRGVHSVVPGPYRGWHYTAFAMRCLLAEIIRLREQVEELKKKANGNE